MRRPVAVGGAVAHPAAVPPIMHPRIPEPIRPTLQNYVSLVNQQVPGLVKACFIEGSIALGEFNEHFSVTVAQPGFKSSLTARNSNS
jgi:hypothetical protein